MKTRRLFTILFLVMFLSACAPRTAPSAVPALSPSATPVQGTSTSVPTITPTVNPFAINMKKINTFPESMQAVLDDPEKYQMAPDPLGNPPENGELAFESWFDSLTHALGDQELLPVNILADSFTLDTGGSICGAFYASGVYPKPGEGTYFDKGYPTQKNPYFFYFSHNGFFHPVLGVKVGINPNSYYGSGNWGTVFIILDQSGWLQDDGLNTIADIYTGHNIGQGYFLMHEVSESPINDPVTVALMHRPFNWKRFETWDTDMSTRYAIGVGGFIIWNREDK
ncbi:MAG: hypothetical protein GYA58_13050 [Anaerolineaceae bacterium]|nr:hypothetical protein [Anaerolineaceae bacterium]